MDETDEMTAPRARANFLGWPELESQLLQALNAGALANGWLIIGGEGAGKATLAFRLARALLNSDRPPTAVNLDTPQTSRTFSLIASGGHPDLFVAEREFDEKKERYAAEIKVDTVRDLSHFLSHTASMGWWRVAIIDTADDLNRNAANALLKALEEPPPRTAIFVLSSAPGKLLATIRSRCRRIEMRALPDDVVAKFLEDEGAATGDEARAIAAAARGRPGYALSLAHGDGGAAIAAVDEFWRAALSGRDVGPIAQQMTARAADGVWALFQPMLIEKLGDAAVAAARDGGNSDPSALIDMRERINSLFIRGEAVNLDRFQLVLAAARVLVG
jgi:DNA polymerase-3 subunit delta'